MVLPIDEVKLKTEREFRHVVWKRSPEGGKESLSQMSLRFFCSESMEAPWFRREV